MFAEKLQNRLRNCHSLDQAHEINVSIVFSLPL